MRRILVALLLALSAWGVSAVPASARGGFQPLSRGGRQDFRSPRHGLQPVAPGLHHRHHVSHFSEVRHPHAITFFPSFVIPSTAYHYDHVSHIRAVRHPHSIIFFPSFVIPSTACDPVRMGGRFYRVGHEWVWVSEHWRCR